jgi:putative N-acetylmannosamine-6-phosphate epimerase
MDKVKVYADGESVIVPTGTYSETFAGAATEREIVAKDNGKRQVPLNCEWRLAENATALLTVTLFADTGSAETELWTGYFGASDLAGTVIGFTTPKAVPPGCNLSYTVTGGTEDVTCNCDYVTLSAQ